MDVISFSGIDSHLLSKLIYRLLALKK